ncbi:MAG: hypothetical protein AB8B91_22000 [Rubripirellula sp.]
MKFPHLNVTTLTNRLCELRCVAPIVFSLLTLLATSAFAQTDRLYPSDGNVVIGKVKSVSKGGVVLTVKGKDQNFAAGEIERILFQGDPTELSEGREFVMDGQYERALTELKKLDIGALPRSEMKAEAQYYITKSQGEMALGGQGDLNTATKTAMAFVTKNSDSWHFYETAKLLGDLAKAMGNFDQALRFYSSLRSAPSMDMKVESVYLIGLVKLAKDDLAGAKTDLAKVSGLKASTPGMKRLQTLAKAALAVITAKEGNGEEAIKMVNGLIATLNPTDTETAAQIYNAQGASYQAIGDDEGALLAYLHTQLMYSIDAQSHVEALKQLIELWGKVGKPDRAAQSRAELQQRYPGLSG